MAQVHCCPPSASSSPEPTLAGKDLGAKMLLTRVLVSEEKADLGKGFFDATVQVGLLALDVVHSQGKVRLYFSLRSLQLAAWQSGQCPWASVAREPQAISNTKAGCNGKCNGSRTKHIEKGALIL